MKEFVDFLGSQAPYDALDAADLETLAKNIEVEYFAAGTIVVEAGREVLDHLWVVRTGALDIVDRGMTVDQLVPGDTFGHISMLSSLAPALTVRAAEDSLCLRLPDPRTILAHPERLRFSPYGALISHQRLISEATLARGERPVGALMRPVVRCDAAEPVAVVARRIGEAAHSCALVKSADGIGIVTDRDFRERVATGEISPQAPVGDLATLPILTVTEDFSQTAAFARMVDRGVHHLVVMGRFNQAVGVVRVVDFAAADIRSPLMIRNAVETADTLPALIGACRLLPPTVVELAETGVPGLQIGNLLAAVVDAVIRKLLDLQGVADSPPAQSWIVLGSMARREPLPLSDVDTAILWADTADDETTGALVRERAEAVLTDLERCGLKRCAEGANATNPLFSRSHARWSEVAGRWITHPDAQSALLLSSIALDSRPLTELPLGRTLTDVMRRSARSAEFLHAFMLEALAVKPPTGFVRDFVVDHTGTHRGQLNLKRGGLLPVAAIGRFVAAVTGDSRGSTVDRLHRGAAADVLTVDESDTLVGAFEQVYELLLRRDVAAMKLGSIPSRHIDPRELDRLTRRHLRESFRAIAAVQDSVESRWSRRLRS